MNGKLPITHTVPGTKYKKTVQLFGTFAMNGCKNVTFTLQYPSACADVWLKNCFHYFHETLCWVILLKWTFYITTFFHYGIHIKCTSLNIYQSKTCFEHDLYKNIKHIFCVLQSVSINKTDFLINKKEGWQMCQNCQALHTLPDFFMHLNSSRPKNYVHTLQSALRKYKIYASHCSDYWNCFFVIWYHIV